VLQGGLKGVEREALRVTPAGRISHAPHPAALGSALASEHVTTDFSEALIELVTPAFPTSWELLQYLCDLHQFVHRHLGEELLWAASMPCAIDGDADVPTARYGASHVGRMKHVYREGLRHRYGAMMQAISGVHYNYSFPARLWEVYAAVREERGAAQPSARRATSSCCATTGVWRGSCCTCSVPRRWWAATSSATRWRDWWRWMRAPPACRMRPRCA
jgi:glutamate--cysteine ligase